MSKPNDLAETSDRLLGELRGMITDAREQLAQTANAALTMLYWSMGRRLNHELLGEKRAEYGKQIVAAVGRHLSGEFGSGFSEKNLWRMVQFAEAFPDRNIVAALRRQLGWTHFRTLIPLKDPLKRELYAEMCLCAGKKEEQIELPEIDQSSIHVAECFTALPSRELLRRKLHSAIAISRARLENRDGGVA